ncbi:unnamed protein product [Rhizoctonia solani]|uniref:F-box domain-containing protein n=1 Tax=Rhizoctonia solani TaxID=456999 RepID=A0A8H3C632_9AGAM|nr:unnamed protein product [Rhizoctonia solani]
MSTPNQLPPTAIKKWQDAGASLIVASKDYLDLCLDLAHDSFSEAEKPTDIATRIDMAFDNISDQLLKIKSTLGRTRNRLVSPLHRLPEEVLSTIFMNVVFDLNHPGVPDSTLMEEDIHLIYRRLYRLLGVCSTWRDILVARGVFWSMIPMVISPSTKKQAPFELSMQRAGGAKLHLVAVAESPDISQDVVEILTKFGPRFRAITLSAGDQQVLIDSIDQLLQQGQVGTLTELSIRSIDAFNSPSWFPSGDSYILKVDDSRQTSFVRLLAALTTFHINGAHFYWPTISFSARLVELWIENITLGYDDAILPFLHALSSASQLRELKIITVDTFRRRDSISTPMDISPPVIFPTLQSLFIRDIFCNTLRSLLRAIAPGSYHLTFFLRETSLQNNLYYRDFDGEEFEQPDFGLADVDELCGALKRAPINTLMLSESSDPDRRLKSTNLQALMGAMPSLKTLTMHGWSFDKDVWNSLTRPQTDQTDQQTHSFPALENLYLSEATILSDEGFQDMVVSHPLRRVVVGATAAANHSDDTQWEPLSEDSSAVMWLRNHVPDFHLVGSRYCPPEFQPVRWRFAY